MYLNFSLEPVAEGVYAAIAREEGKAVSNAGIIDTGKATVVFDTFLSPEAALELKKAAADITGRKPAYVVNSHYHIDHTGGNLIFGDEAVIVTGKTTWESAASKNVELLGYYRENGSGILEHFSSELEKATDEEVRRQLEEQLLYAQTIADRDFDIVLPQLTFKDKLTIHGPSNDVELFNLYNGHTECDTIAYIPDKCVMFAGDTVFVGRHPWLGAGDPHTRTWRSRFFC